MAERAFQAPARLTTALLPFLSWLPTVRAGTIRADLAAGLTGAIIVLPQSVAYALIAGLPAQYGLYTAIVPALVGALYGSSHHNITGPTAANSIVVLAVIGAMVPPGDPNYVATVITLTFLVGVFQLGLGLLRLGTLVNFVSDTVVIGFTAGAAALIALSQLRYVTGIPLGKDLGAVATVTALVEHISEGNLYALAIAATTILATLLVQYLRPRWPAMFIGMIAGSLLGIAMQAKAHGVALVGALPGHLPPFSIPNLSAETVPALISPAVTLGILALVQATSAARAVAVRSGQRIDGNQEFIGQGLANLLGSFFSSYAASGSFTRTGANYDAGARTPLAAVFATMILVAALLIVPGATRYLPMPAMGGTVLLIAWNLINFARIRHILRVSRREAAVLVITFLATLFLELQFAIYAGVLLSLILYLQRTAHPRMVEVAPMPGRAERPLRNAAKRDLVECPQLKLLRIDGSLFFGATDHVQSVLTELTERGYRHIMLIGSAVNFVDIAGAQLLASEARRLRALGGGLYLCSFKDPALATAYRGGYLAAVGDANVFSNPEEGIATVFERLDAETCAVCTKRIFHECQRLPPPRAPAAGEASP